MADEKEFFILNHFALSISIFFFSLQKNEIPILPTSTIYSTPFALHCREVDIGLPEGVELDTFGTLQESIEAKDLLIVDLLLHSLAEEDSEWFPKDTATSNMLDQLKDILIPYLSNGGVLTVLVYDEIDIKDSRTEEETWRVNHEWFDSIIPIEIETGSSQSPKLDTISEKGKQYFNHVESAKFRLDMGDVPSEYVKVLAWGEDSEPIAVALNHLKDPSGKWRQIDGRILFLPRPSTLSYDFEGMVRNLVDVGYSYVPEQKKYQVIDEQTAPDYPDEQSVLIDIELVLSRFPIVAKNLENRYSDRETIEIEDEFDVQDLLHGLLRIYFDDVRKEEWCPSYAGTSPRMDFLLKDDSISVEVKIARSDHKQKNIKEELAIDKDHYRSHPDCITLVCFVYDPDFVIENAKGFENDISEETTNLDTYVFVHPKFA